MNAIMTTIHDQSQSSWADDWQFVSYYNWTGTPGALSPQVPNSGNGEPKMANGLVASSHRPSDDLCVFSKSLLFHYFEYTNTMARSSHDCEYQGVTTDSNQTSSPRTTP